MADLGDMGGIQARLDALRASGAAERDPVRFAYLQALSRRTARQAEPIRQPLIARLHTLADELAHRPARTAQAEKPAGSPLADLLVYLGEHAHPATGNPTVNRKFEPKSKIAAAGLRPQSRELKSVAYFRNEWSKLSTEQQLTQTLAQAPENAGPMNAQHLVLRSLQVMRDISPDYLQGFMSYIDSLIWLDHADPSKPTAGRSSAGESAKKPQTAKRGATRR